MITDSLKEVATIVVWVACMLVLRPVVAIVLRAVCMLV